MSEMFGDRFTIEGLLGRGGMGEVHLAVDEKLGRKVAIKTIPLNLSGNTKLRERLQQEARTLAAVSHPSIAQVYDVVDDGNKSFLVLEFVKGESLAEILREGPLSEDVTLRLAVDIAEGMAAAHALGIVHRDLKPENVIVTPEGRAKILDFGLATMLDQNYNETEREASMAGTLNAMSPEQVERQSVDYRSDLFSFGNLLYQMLTGAHPFRRDLPVETMQRIANHHPPSPDQLNAAIPPRLAQLVMALLEKVPEERLQPAEKVALVLHRFRSLLEAEATDARQALKRKRRWRVIVPSLILGLTIASAMWWLLTRPGPPATPLSVAILKPTVSGEDPNERLTIVSSGVRLAAINALAELEGIMVINSSEIDVIEGGPREIALAVAADEVISLTITGLGLTSIVEIKKLDGLSGSILWTDRVEIPNNDLWLLTDTMAAHLARAYQERSLKKGAFHVRASPEAYESYLEIRLRALSPDAYASLPELLDELADIRSRAPELLNVYMLETSVARYLYESTRDPAYLRHGQEVVDAAQQIAPNDYRTLSATAEIAVVEEDPGDTVATIAELKRMDPTNLGVLYQEARFAELQGNKNTARILYETIVSRHPSWQNLINLSRVETTVGAIQDARKHLDKAREQAPNNLLVRSSLARFEMSFGDPKRAEEIFLTIVAKNPNAENLSILGTCQLLIGRYEEALRNFNLAFSLGSHSTVTMLNMADCYDFKGNHDQARSWYEEVVRFQPENRQLTAVEERARVQALAHVNRGEEAISAVQRALILTPDSPQDLYVASIVYVLLNEPSTARKYIKKAQTAGVSPIWFNLPWFDNQLKENAVALSSSR